MKQLKTAVMNYLKTTVGSVDGALLDEQGQEIPLGGNACASSPAAATARFTIRLTSRPSRRSPRRPAAPAPSPEKHAARKEQRARRIRGQAAALYQLSEVIIDETIKRLRLLDADLELVEGRGVPFQHHQQRQDGLAIALPLAAGAGNAFERLAAYQQQQREISPRALAALRFLAAEIEDGPDGDAADAFDELARLGMIETDAQDGATEGAYPITDLGRRFLAAHGNQRSESERPPATPRTDGA